MPKFKSLLVQYQLVTAGRLRKCYHSKKCKIVKGDTVLEVRTGLPWQGYCIECAQSMVADATADLKQLSSSLASARMTNTS